MWVCFNIILSLLQELLAADSHWLHPKSHTFLLVGEKQTKYVDYVGIHSTLLIKSVGKKYPDLLLPRF